MGLRALRTTEAYASGREERMSLRSAARAESSLAWSFIQEDWRAQRPVKEEAPAPARRRESVVVSTGAWVSWVYP